MREFAARREETLNGLEERWLPMIRLRLRNSISMKMALKVGFTDLVRMVALC